MTLKKRNMIWSVENFDTWQGGWICGMIFATLILLLNYFIKDSIAWWVCLPALFLAIFFWILFPTRRGEE